MKKAFVLFLLVSCILTGCGKEPNADPTQSDTTPTASVTTEPSQATVPTETIAAETTEPLETAPVIPTVPSTDKPKEPVATDPPATQPQETTSPGTEPPTTTPPATEPKPTQPPATEPPETEPIPTEPEKVAIDTGSIEEYARNYAASMGFVIDTSLGKDNSGYYPPDYRPLTSTNEGYSAAAGLVSATRNQLNSRFSEEKSDVLVEGAYGLARMNCLVEYSHTDELGDWYYIYVLYG